MLGFRELPPEEQLRRVSTIRSIRATPIPVRVRATTRTGTKKSASGSTRKPADPKAKLKKLLASMSSADLKNLVKE